MSLPPHDPLLNARRTGYTRSGFGARYHAHRPKPPAALVDVLLQLAGTRRPRLVVDLGSGTGISTMLWAPHAERVVGVEPLDEMRKIAEAGNASGNVSFKAGVAQQTGVPDGAADIVTCAQSLHHTEPAGAMREIGRILRPGGVFAAYDYDWPPMVHWEANQAFAVFMDGIRALRTKHGLQSEEEQWGKDQHTARIYRSGVFRHVSEMSLRDVVSLRFGIRFGHILGHRGLSHSIFLAAVLATVVTIFVRHIWPESPGAARLWPFFFVATASHGLLDSMTNGGLGVAFFAPFSNDRYFLPWRPILVSPMSVHVFLGYRRSEEHTSELQSLRHLVCRLLLEKKKK